LLCRIVMHLVCVELMIMGAKKLLGVVEIRRQSEIVFVVVLEPLISNSRVEYWKCVLCVHQ
jgi:hypothetical protein